VTQMVAQRTPCRFSLRARYERNTALLLWFQVQISSIKVEGEKNTSPSAGFFLLRSPPDRARSVLNCRAMGSGAGNCPSGLDFLC
jgi:hypothetical protein